MLDKLPIELVGAVLSSAAEYSFIHDRTALLNIALSNTIGYLSAISVMYRTLTINEQNMQTFNDLFNDADNPIGTSIFAEHKSNRLFPHIRRIFIGPGAGSATIHLRNLPRLEALYTCATDSASDAAAGPLAPTFTRLILLTAQPLRSIPSTLTHISYFFHFKMQGFQEYTRDSLRDHVTQVAVELNAPVPRAAEPELLRMLLFLLTRTPRTTVAIRLYRDAMLPETKALFFRALRAIAREDLTRVLVWFDARPVHNNKGDIELSRQDALMGRTPWSEGQVMTLEGLEAAAAKLISS